MPLSLRRGTVSAVIERVEGLARIEVDGRPCIAYPRLTGPVALGDEVLVNVQAVELGLGSGGFDILYANLTRGLGLAPESGAQIVKLPYTPLQAAVPHAEEGASLPADLGGLPVVCCTLHSQVAPVCAGIGSGVATAYVQLDGAALPVSLSDAVRVLKERGLLGAAVAAGACLDGDVACVSTASALAWAASAGYDVAVCSVGPGLVGTGTFLGHGATALAEAVNVTSALAGRPILAPRVSTVDARARHRGLSHHTLAVLELSLGDVTVAWPAGLAQPAELVAGTGSERARIESVDVAGWEKACAGLPLASMGRGPADDPWLFAAAYAAGRLARRCLE